jgi:CelD/BcsL family acetyltransferase involved in cellulose biosynthesis
MFETRLITTSTELAALQTPWNILATGRPMCSWNWLATWWKYYGRAGDRALHVLTIYDVGESDEGILVGVAPWYMERTAVGGNVVQPLGNGQVCTDHLSLLCRPDLLGTVTTTIANYLTDNDDAWDRLELTSIDDDDQAMALLVAGLEARDALVTAERSGNCWVIDLPATYDEYLATLSNSHRGQLQKCYRERIESGRCRWHQVTKPSELEEAWQILIDLHQRRRRGLGDAGCFASPEFTSFHRDVITQLLAAGQLRLSWTELDGAPFTAEYHFSSPDTVYTYQSGMDADRLDESPGRLAYLLTVKRAIEEGYTHLDFLRGDERYKAHFRAEARPTFDYHVFPNRPLARLRGQMLTAATTVKEWMKQSARLAKS